MDFAIRIQILNCNIPTVAVYWLIYSVMVALDNCVSWGVQWLKDSPFWFDIKWHFRRKEENLTIIYITVKEEYF